jgi:hypothetical protein
MKMRMSENTANSKKIAFISCVNNELEYGEARYYLERLEVPEGYETDFINVGGAASMTEGYNAAMQSSDAKYKVYMHQDVFIINRGFIGDMLRVFQADENIGMMGCIGTDELPINAHAVESYNVGAIRHNCTPPYLMLRQNEDRTPVDVEALDGLLLATQVDVPWREDLFDGWDFYDVSQCFEMIRRGYRVVVPYQDEPWCYHDNNYSKMTNYQKYCDRFVDEYQDVRHFEHIAYSGKMCEIHELKEKSYRQMIRLVDAGEQAALQEMFEAPENRGYLHLRAFEILAAISGAEEQAGGQRFWQEGDTWETLCKKLALLRFAVKRREYGADDENLWADVEKSFSRHAIESVAAMYTGERA